MQRHNKSAGEYDHKAYHPVKDFLSGLLDMTIIKPLVECVTGKDLITGECLTETEKGWKLIGACIDLFTFGQGAQAIKGAGLAGKQALKTIGRTMIVDMLSNTAGYTVAYECDELGMPMAVTWMLSVFTGCTVSAAAGKYIIKDADGLVKEIAPEDVDDFLKELEMKTGGTVEVESIPEVGQASNGRTKADILAQNRIQGRAYEQQEFAYFSSQNSNAVEQITIKTESGVRTRVDAIGIDANGNVVINEFKSSATAPLTNNQKIAFPEIMENGGVVVGKGKGIFAGGYQIPPGTQVKIIKPQ